MDEQLDQSDSYFKQEGFKRLFEQMRMKYQSLGHFGGTIHLNNLSNIEKQTLNGFIRKDLSHQVSLSITIKKIRKLLLDTKFADIELETILFHYYKDDEIMSNRQKHRIYLDVQFAFFKELLTPFIGTPASTWYMTMVNECNGINQTFSRRYEVDKEKLKVQLSHVLTALNKLPMFEHKKKRMPIFASEITGNPHAFDEGGPMYSLLIQGACYFVDVPYSSGMDAETRMNVLYEAGILKDDISSFTITYGLCAYCFDQELLGWRNFMDRKEPLLLSLSNLYDVTKISGKQYVFVVENPSVFSALIEYCKEQDINTISFICTYGQLRVASIQILDILVQNGHRFYYAGDFDPEGLQIAQKLCQRYQNACVLWRYEDSDFQVCLSNEEIGDIRLRKLDSIIEPSLHCIKNCLQNSKRCGYQEHLITAYKEDILILSRNTLQ